MTREDLIMNVSWYEAEIYDLHSDWELPYEYVKGVRETLEFLANMHLSNDLDNYKTSQLIDYYEMMQKVLECIDEKYKLDR